MPLTSTALPKLDNRPSATNLIAATLPTALSFTPIEIPFDGAQRNNTTTGDAVRRASIKQPDRIRDNNSSFYKDDELLAFDAASAGVDSSTAAHTDHNCSTCFPQL